MLDNFAPISSNSRKSSVKESLASASLYGLVSPRLPPSNSGGGNGLSAAGGNRRPVSALPPATNLFNGSNWTDDFEGSEEGEVPYTPPPGYHQQFRTRRSSLMNGGTPEKALMNQNPAEFARLNGYEYRAPGTLPSTGVSPSSSSHRSGGGDGSPGRGYSNVSPYPGQSQPRDVYMELRNGDAMQMRIAGSVQRGTPPGRNSPRAQSLRAPANRGSPARVIYATPVKSNPAKTGKTGSPRRLPEEPGHSPVPPPVSPRSRATPVRRLPSCPETPGAGSGVQSPSSPDKSGKTNKFGDEFSIVSGSGTRTTGSSAAQTPDDSAAPGGGSFNGIPGSATGSQQTTPSLMSFATGSGESGKRSPAPPPGQKISAPGAPTPTPTPVGPTKWRSQSTRPARRQRPAMIYPAGLPTAAAANAANQQKVSSSPMDSNTISSPTTNVTQTADFSRNNSSSGDSRRSSGSQPQNEFTLVLLGAPRVGKSALVNQFLWEVFVTEYRPTVEEFQWVEYACQQPGGKKPSGGGGRRQQQRRQSSIGGGGVGGLDHGGDEKPPNFYLQIIDSSGSRDFLAMRHLYYRVADAFMVVYNVNEKATYAEALQMIQEINEKNTKNAPILLVGNKSDLRKADTDSPTGTPVTADPDPERQRLAQSVRRMCVSARSLPQVKGAFWWLVDELARRRLDVQIEPCGDELGAGDGGDAEEVFGGSTEHSPNGDGGMHLSGSPGSGTIAKRRAAAAVSSVGHNAEKKLSMVLPSFFTAGRTNGAGLHHRGSSARHPAQNSSARQSATILVRRRQSIPSRRTAAELGIDEAAFEQLLKRHQRASAGGGGVHGSSRSQCSIQ